MEVLKNLCRTFAVQYNRIFGSAKVKALKIPLIYMAIGWLWILLTDRMLPLFGQDMAAIAKFTAYRGWVFVLVSACALYPVLLRDMLKIQAYADDLKKTGSKMIQLEHYDRTTGLPNRVFFEKSLDAALRQAGVYNRIGAVLYMDLDNFKTINDTFGHAFGDMLLKKAGEILKAFAADGATVFRMGGDEYAVLLPEVKNKEDILQLADDILQSFQKPWYIDKYEFFSTTSIGISLFPENGNRVYAILKAAETSMYNVKEAGGNSFRVYSPNMNQLLTEKLEMENSLRHAAERNELVLHYQPQVSLETGSITGFEALVRWNHPAMGMVSPGKFIPIAEESGLINPIGEWVLKTACNQNKAWQDMGYEPVHISVNLSAHQFLQPDLKGKIQKILADTGLEPKWLNLEITESTAMKDLEFSLRILRELRDIGINVSLDDFGTGYSSLNYLKRLPITVVKIDKSFVNDIKESSAEEAIALAIIDLSHRMGLTVVAEGVETAEQLVFLQKNHCDAVQGYYFSRPRPSEQIEEMLEQGTRFYCSYPREDSAGYVI